MARNESNAGTQYCYGTPGPETYASPRPMAEVPSASSQRSDVVEGLQYIRQMDPTFDENVFRETCSDIFLNIQAGWANRDFEPIKGLLSAEALSVLTEDVDKLRRERKAMAWER